MNTNEDHSNYIVRQVVAGHKEEAFLYLMSLPATSIPFVTLLVQHRLVGSGIIFAWVSLLSQMARQECAPKADPNPCVDSSCLNR